MCWVLVESLVGLDFESGPGIPRVRPGVPRVSEGGLPGVGRGRPGRPGSRGSSQRLGESPVTRTRGGRRETGPARARPGGCSRRGPGAYGLWERPVGGLAKRSELMQLAVGTELKVVAN